MRIGQSQTTMIVSIFSVSAVIWAFPWAQIDAKSPGKAEAAYAGVVLDDHPLAYWRFESGDRHHAEGRHLDGVMDEVAMYPTVLSAERVAAHYEAIRPFLPPRRVEFPDPRAPKAAPTTAAESETSGGWRKYQNNPVLGGDLGTCFDVSLLKDEDRFRMWFSWRPKQSLALVESADGVQWNEPKIVLGPKPGSDWEKRINRPAVLKRGDTYHMWYTGQTRERSCIGYATSADGVTWQRMSKDPVLSADSPWEKNIAVMCPHVLWDEQAQVYRMWYSGGEQYEPNAIGYATSKDGLTWTKHPNNPVFRADKDNSWEQHKVTACQVVREGDWHVMFYIGFEDEDLAQIGVARSRDGITGWERHPANPIIRARVRPGAWDFDACYKPYAILDRGRWLLWYNGRKGGVEQIGMAMHDGRELWPQARARKPSPPAVLKPDAFKHYVDGFNRHDEELYPQHVRNVAAWDFLRDNTPFFECPDKDLEEIYYFRWWTYRKHIKHTPDGFVITEFLPEVGWSGKHNTISCPAGHHFYEGRWLHDPRYLDDYSVFWFRKGGEPRRYSFWVADALYARHLVCPDEALIVGLLDDLVANYEAWEKSRLGPEGLFWQIDDRDGMEVSIGGSGYRATINSYMYGDAVAIARIARLAGRKELAETYEAKAARIKELVQTRLWDPEAKFFKVLPRRSRNDLRPAESLADVRELHGYTPWYFKLSDPGYEEAWRQLMDPQGFYAPFGPTTAEQRHPKFCVSYEGHECQWNGPSWPYSTSMTLAALANLLNGPPQDHVSATDYFDLLKIYAQSHRLKREGGRIVPWIDENLNPMTGDWIARTRLKTWKNGTWDPGKGGVERGKDYNHSTFCDLVITGIVGLRPRADNVVEVNPLVPAETWDHFCLDNILYHGRSLTILWDKTGEKYGKGKGLRVFADGRQIATKEALERVTGELPAAASAATTDTQKPTSAQARVIDR